MKDKRASDVIGPTMTWVAASFVIMVILIFYFVALIFLGAEKGKIEINKNVIGNSDLDLMENLIFVLNNEMEYKGEEVLIKDAVKIWADNQGGISDGEIIGDELGKEFVKLNFDCYLFQAEFEGGGTLEDKKIKIMDLTGYGGQSKSRDTQVDILEKGVNFKILSNEKIIDIGFYGGVC